MTRSDPPPVTGQPAGQGPVEDFQGQEHEGRPEVIFVLLAGGIYGVLVGFCLQGTFATAALCVLTGVACTCFGWWARGVR